MTSAYDVKSLDELLALEDFRSDFSYDPTLSSLIPAEEKYTYGIFLRNYVTYRASSIPRQLTPIKDLELPNESVYHTIPNLLNPDQSDITLDLTDPILTNERYRIYHEYVMSITQETEDYKPPFPITDKYRQTPFRYIQQIREFYIHHRNIRRMVSRTATLGTRALLPVFSYNVPLHVRVFGTFAPYRRFDLFLRTLLNNVLTINDRHQYIHIPISPRVYSKEQFTRAFQKLSLATVRFHDDFSYYFLIHFLGWLYQGETTSLLKQIPAERLDTLNIVFTLGEKAIVYNLAYLNDMNVSQGFWLRVYRHLTTLKLSAEFEHEHPEEKIEEIAEQKAAVEQPNPPVVDEGDVAAPVQHDQVALPPEFLRNRIAPSHQLHAPTPAKTTHVDTAAAAAIVSDHKATDKQKNRAVEVATAYKAVQLDGISLEDWIDTVPIPPVSSSTLDFLKEELPDPSMAESSIMDMDSTYISQMMNKDLASVATSFSSSGMFLTDIEHKDEVTELNRVRTFKLTYEDPTGRKHPIVFKFPIVSGEGTILVNGISSRLVKQNVNLPICKVSRSRVSLASNFNKTIVERVTTKAHSFDNSIIRYINAVLRADIGLTVHYGKYLQNPIKLPFDYTAIASRYSQLKFRDYRFHFDHATRFDSENLKDVVATEKFLTESEVVTHGVRSLEKHYGIYCGRHGKNPMYFGFDNHVKIIDTGVFIRNSNTKDWNPVEAVLSSRPFTTIFYGIFGEDISPPKNLTEWTELKILDKNFPTVFILGYQFGLEKVFEMIGLDYKFYPKGTRYPRTYTTISIPFSDGNLVFDRYPLEKSLIASGLAKYKTANYVYDAFNDPDIYYSLLTDSRMSLNYLKGITDHFNLFIDPITHSVLKAMNEPTTFAGLITRATEMVSTWDCYPSSSIRRNHRVRGYERFNAILYKTMARALAAYTHQRGSRRPFSINPNDVLLKIIGDPALQVVEEINPLHDIKGKTTITYTGDGGRTARAFVVPDRVYPDDAVGVISEATPDSSKVAITTYSTVNPAISNVRGMFDQENLDPSKMEPSQLLSASALLMPYSTHDDMR